MMPGNHADTGRQSKLDGVVIVFCSTTVLHSMRLGIDVNRHKEIIVKAISALLLLLLRYFKLNHVYEVGYN